MYNNLYLHIGYPKTGTTSFQNILYNDKSLEKFFIFPHFLSAKTNQQGNCICLINSLLKNIHGGIPENGPEIGKKYDIIDIFKLLKKQLNCSQEKNIVISTENLYIITDEYYSEKIYNLFENFLQQFKKVHIIVTLLRQDTFVNAFLQQLILKENIYSYSNNNLEIFIEKHRWCLDYYKSLNNIQKFFKNIILKVFIYNKEIDINYSIFKYINKNINISSNIHLNQSLYPENYVLGQYLREYINIDPESLYNILYRIKEISTRKYYRYITYEESKKIFETYKNSNSKLRAMLKLDKNYFFDENFALPYYCSASENKEKIIYSYFNNKNIKLNDIIKGL